MNRIAALISALLIISGCTKLQEPVSCIDIVIFSFKHTYLRYFHDEESYFIKGVALNVNKHGREIKVIEDLKGNFTGKSSIFVWGSTGVTCDNKGRHDARIDFITQYQKNDTLIMFIGKANKRFNGDFERTSDYTTLYNYSSVVKLSNDHVAGYINNWGVDVLWDELQDELQTRLKSYEKPPLWTEDLMPDPFIIAYKGIEKSKWTYPISAYETNNYSFIKGTVLDYYQNDGIRFKIINDFTGNLPKENNTVIVWGIHNAQFLSGRLDDLKLYNRQDTLLMLLRQVSILEERGSNNLEKIGDYSTLYYSFSALKLSKNSVSGYINSTYNGEENISWEEFQTILNLK